MKSLMNASFDEQQSVREHIMELVELGNKLNSLDVTISESFIVHAALNSLPEDYEPLRSSYIAQKDKWSLDELIAICVQQELQIKKNKAVKSVNLVHNAKPHNSKPNPKETSKPIGVKKFNNNYKVNKPVGIRCFFCRKFGHVKKDCNRYKKWLEKQKAKGKVHNVSVCLESNLVNVDRDTWWLDTGASIHITNTLQGFISKR